MKVMVCDAAAWPLWFRPIAVMQSYLRLISRFYPSIPMVFRTGVFGEDTAAAVSAFQQEFKLPVTGNIDLATWNMIVSVWQHLEQLSTGEGEYNLAVPPGQTVLATLGEEHNPLVPMLQTILQGMAGRFQNMPPVRATGVYDEPTSRAVQSFQRLADLPNEPAYLDRITWNKLVGAWCSLCK